MEFPPELKYSREHEWVRMDRDVATIGVTDFAQDELGDIVYLILPKVGETLTQFAKMGEIESVKSVSDLYTPLGGEVIEVNETVIDTPEIVNQAPYAGGWLVRLRITDPTQTDKLMSADDYRAIAVSSH